MCLRPSLSSILDTVLCFLAVLGLGSTLVPDYRHVATISYVATDFKTLYASATLFSQHQDPYSIPGLVTIFRRDSIAEPATWFSRSPVYPPVTLNLIAPLTSLPMPRAAQAWFALSLLAYASALALVLCAARRATLGRLWRMGILALAVANPMLAYALEVGNASVLTSALAVSAWMLLAPCRPEARRQWLLPALLLATALLLKPHLAFWVVVGLALLATGSARRAALASTLLAGAATVLSALALAFRGSLASTLHSYSAILAAEQASGSMSAASRELLPLPAQITAAQSLFGLVLSPMARNLLTIALLLALAALLLATRKPGTDPSHSILGVSAVAAFGLIATYHRAHDSLILLPLLVWIANALARAAPSRTLARLAPGTILTLLLLLWFPIPAQAFRLRQAAIVLFAMDVLLASQLFLAFPAKKGGMNGIQSMPGGQ